MSYYYAYRVFLNDTNPKGVASIFREQKESFFKNSVTQLLEDKKVKINHYGESYILHKSTLSDDLFLWQLAKTKQFNKPVITKDKIEDVPDTQHPYVYTIISIKHQIILIENDTTIFQDVKSAAGKIEFYFNEYLKGYAITAKLNEISDINDIDYEMEQFDSINTIDMLFDPPNFFRGERDIDKIVNDMHESTGFENMKIVVSNSLEGLSLNTKKVSKFLGRLASGAGNYIVKGIKDGVKKTIKSVNFQAKKIYKDIEKTDVNKIEEDIEVLNNLNNNQDEK